MVIPKNKKHGFTIVELIVVIVVIGILATIGLVSYSGYRTRAAKSASESSASQVKLKLGEYFTDNNNYPRNKQDVKDYLTGIGSTTLAAEFDATVSGNPKYTYSAAANSGGGACNNVATPCTYYILTAKKEGWGGSGSDTVFNP